MSEFHEMIVESFIWTDEIPTIGIIGNRLYCNRDWWMGLSEIAKIKYIEHELKHLMRK